MHSERYVYVIQAGASGPIKVGIAVNPKQRLTGIQTSHYETLRLVHTVRYEESEDAVRVEKAAHTALRAQGKRLRGEWFAISLSDALEIIRQAERVCKAEGTLGLPPKRRKMDPIDRMMRHVTPAMQRGPNYDEEERQLDRLTFLKNKALYHAAAGLPARSRQK